MNEWILQNYFDFFSLVSVSVHPLFLLPLSSIQKKANSVCVCVCDMSKYKKINVWKLIIYKGDYLDSWSWCCITSVSLPHYWIPFDVQLKCYINGTRVLLISHSYLSSGKNKKLIFPLKAFGNGYVILSLSLSFSSSRPNQRPSWTITTTCCQTRPGGLKSWSRVNESTTLKQHTFNMTRMTQP